jgi:hypothetical protein
MMSASLKSLCKYTLCELRKGDMKQPLISDLCKLFMILFSDLSLDVDTCGH